MIDSLSCMMLLSVPNSEYHQGTVFLTPKDHLDTHGRSYSVSGGLVVHEELVPTGQTLTANLKQQMGRMKYPLNQKEPVFFNCKDVLFLHMCRGFPRILHVELTERRCAIDISPRILHQLITTSSFPWTTYLVGDTGRFEASTH